VYMCHAEAPSHICLQRHTDSTQIEDLSSRSADFGTLPLIEEPQPSDRIVAALFADDDMWYRAKVLPENKVLFVDHGNTSDLKEIRELPEELSNIPSMAQKARLAHPSGGEWSEQATEAVMDYLDGRPLTVKQVLHPFILNTLRLHSPSVTYLLFQF